jgi:hypothetical protein
MVARPLTDILTRVPSWLISAAVVARQTKVTLCPAISNLLPKSDP